MDRPQKPGSEPAAPENETSASEADTAPSSNAAESAPNGSVEPLPEGIYFGLEDDKYHADPSLGSHSVIRLRSGAPNYWWDSWMNPLREEDGEAESAALSYGRAVHKLVLEGQEAFDAAYTREPTPEEWPKALRTADEIKARLKELGEKTSGLKAELVERLRAADPTAMLWDDIIEFARAGGRTLLKPKIHTELLLSGRMISRNPHLQPSFRDGYSEVSVFWREDGVPCKARIDYLKLRATVDLKSIVTTRNTRSFDSITRNAIAEYRYDMQHAHYREGRERARQFVTEGKVFDLTNGATLPHLNLETGEVEQRPTMPPAKWLNAFSKLTDYVWVWVFLGKAGPPLAKGYEFRNDDPAAELAADDRRRGLQTYRDFMAKYGTSTMWLLMDEVELITGSDLPSWLGAAV